MELKPKALFILFITAIILFSASASQRVKKQEPDYVPLLEIIEYFDFEYQFSPVLGTITIRNLERNIMISTGAREVYAEGRIIRLKQSVVLEGNVIQVPVEGVDAIIKELTGRRLSWSYEDGSFGVTRGRTLNETPRERVNTSSVAPEKVTMLRKQEYTIGAIVLDPGHGGKDPGGMGYNGIKEKDVVLRISSELKKELERKLKGVDIIMTRENDSFVPLEQRGELANSIEPARNPLFVSIHANVSYDSDSSGYESYYLSIDSFGESARDVAMKENSVLKYEINNYNEYLKEIINRIVDVEYRKESMLLANYIQKRLRESVESESIDRGVKSAFFYILKTVAMPAVLIEVGFVTHKEEAKKLLDPEYQNRVARGIASGIEDFLLTFQKTAGFTR